MIRRVEGLDLLLVTLGSLLALAMAMVQLPVPIRLPVGLLAALILPGYSVSMALLPPGEVDAVERSALAFSLSLGVIVLVAPLLSLSPGGLNQGAMVGTLTAVTLVGAAIAGWRRRGRVTAGNPTGITLPDGRLRHWVGRHPAGSIGLGLGGVLLVTWIAVSVVARPQTASEFFMVGPEGTAESLPARVEAGVPFAITLGISNNDGAAQPYRILVESGAAHLAEMGPILVDPGTTWTGNLVFGMPTPGNDQEVQLLLLRGSDAHPYRSLRLVLDVLAPT